MTDLTEKELAEKLRNECDINRHNGWNHAARRIAEALGVTLAPEKPEPGVYLHDDGTVVEVYGPTPTPVQAFHESNDWLAENRDNLTPARVITEAEHQEMVNYRDAARAEADEVDRLKAERDRWKDLARARELPTREEVADATRKAMRNGVLGTSESTVQEITDAVTALLEGGDDE